ncbi:MAG TPA: hypothetical protein PLD30_00615 [Candidatus Competibacteraceae bacterium]|nr:hypothetical protein [Candidatus Competibacteraceae bacterium]
MGHDTGAKFIKPLLNTLQTAFQGLLRAKLEYGKNTSNHIPLRMWRQLVMMWGIRHIWGLDRISRAEPYQP